MLDEDTENAFDTKGNLHDYLNRRSVIYLLIYNILKGSYR